MAPVGQEAPMHTIDRTPEYEEFMTQLREYHTKRGTTLDQEPKVGTMHLDLFKVFKHIVANGGYDKVSEEKLAWRRMASELGIVSTNEASTAFALKEKFYKNLAAYEISTVHGKEPPPKDILEDVTAKGAGLLTRTRDNFRGKRESNIGASAGDSNASGDDGTPVRERPPVDPAASARASRGLREAPPQRVIFQPDTGPTRTRAASAQHNANHANSPASHNPAPPTPQHSGMPPASQYAHGGRGPSIMHQPPNAENTSQLVASYQPRQLKPLQLRAVATPSNAPTEFQHRPRPGQRPLPDPRQAMLPGTGFDGPNIYTRCLNALRSTIRAEQSFALNHLVKISYERGDKYKFDSFPGLAEGLIEKALEVGGMFYYVDWSISWDSTIDSAEPGVLDGNSGTYDILERIQNLIEKDVPDVLQTVRFSDDMILVTEAVLTLRNMVTLAENAYYMSDFYPLHDLICIILHLPERESLIEMKHLALDMAEQLTPFMVVDSEDPLYKTLLLQLASDDRGVILTSLRALGRISMNLEATNKLKDVSGDVLQRIASWLLLNDDELTDACLDFLYQYTAVVANVDNLIRSLAPENLVDHLVRLLSHGAHKVQQEFVLIPEQKLPARDEIAPIPADLLQEMLKLEEPDRVHRWVQCFFEEDSDSFVTQLAAWQAYQSAFVGPLKTIGQPLITPADFIRNSTSVYKESNAQILREPGDPHQKFIIHGLRARPRPLSLDGLEYARCLWSTNPDRKNEKCGQFYLKSEAMWNHVMTSHLNEKRNDSGQFDNVEGEYKCTWGECNQYQQSTKMHLHDFARHVHTHISTQLPSPDSSVKLPAQRKQWVIPASTMAVTFEETLTVRDERNPNAPPQAAGIPLSAALILRNIARNVVKTDVEEELIKQQSGSDENGGFNEKLFRPMLPRLFEVFAENKALGPYIASLLDLIQVEINDDSSD